jgi:hypothetical protein
MSKVGTPKITGSVLTAAQHSPFLQQSERIIPNTGGTLIIDDIIQFGRGIISYTTIGSFFQDDSTIANTIVLNQQGDFDTPQDAVETWNGMLIRFRPKFANTGNATVNLAGLNGGTPINIVNESGVALSAGELSTNRDAFLRYDLANTRFILLNSTLQSAVETLQSQVIPATTTTQGIAYLNKPITLSYNSTTVIDYSAGTFQFDDGSDSGVLSAGSVDITDFFPTPGNTTTYHLFAVKNLTTSSTTVIFDTSFTSPTLPIGFTKKKWIMAVNTNSSNNIIPFFQDGKTITFDSVTIYNNTAKSSTPEDVAMTTPVGIRVKALCTGFLDCSTGNPNEMHFIDKTTGWDRIVTATDISQSSNPFEVFTDTLGIVQHYKIGGGTQEYKILQHGWEIPDNLY